MKKHLLITIEGKNYYSCNRAVNPTKEKSVRVKEEVTCKNCLRFISGHHTYCQTRKFKVIEE